MRWLLLAALAGIPWLGFRALLASGRRRAAAGLVALWALLLAASLGVMEYRLPGLCGRLFPGAGAYAEAMLRWVRTGSGCEGTPACFVPQHLVHLVLFAALTLATGGFGGLVLATVLFGWMGAYTGQLAMTAGTLWALGIGWHPWAVLRVVGFVLIGVALSEPLVRGQWEALGRNRRWWLWGLALCIADTLLKGLVAETWRVHVLLPLLR